MAAAHCWVESKMFEILGTWVGSTTEVEVKLMLDRHSGHHAWRAGQWWERLPVLADVDRDALFAAEARGSWGEPLPAVSAMSSTVSRLAVAYRVTLPRICVGYARHRSAIDPVADGSTIRTLGILEPDVVADWLEGEARLQMLLTDRRAVAEARHASELVEGLFVNW